MAIDTSKLMKSSLGLVGSGIGAYTNLSPIEEVEQYVSQALQLGNSNYQLGSLLGLADLYAQQNIPLSITGNDLYNPSAGERFSQMFGSGLSGFTSGYSFADNFTGDMGGISYAKKTPQMKEDYFGVFSPKEYAEGGELSLSYGSMVNAAAGLGMAGINMGLNAIGNAQRRKQAAQDALRYNALRDFSIDRNTLDLQRAIDDSTDNMFNMAALQMKANGGTLFTNGGEWSTGLNIIGNGGTHEENPLEGVPMGIAPDGIPNLVEEGEVIYNDYVFSNRLKVNKTLLDKYMLPSKYEGKSYAEVSKELAKESEERPNDSISKKGLEDSMTKLQLAQEEYKAIKDLEKINKLFAFGGKVRKYSGKEDHSQYLFLEEFNPQNIFDAVIAQEKERIAAQIEAGNLAAKVLKVVNLEPIIISDYTPTTKISSEGLHPRLYTNQTLSKNDKKNSKSSEDKSTETLDFNSIFRYTPTLIQGIQALKGNKVDYTNPNLIAANTKSINFTPLGDYMALERLPFVSTIGNQMQAQLAATNAAIMNAAANRAAAIPSLITSGYKGQTALADATLEAAKYNNLLALTEAEFNRGTNQANLTTGLNVAKVNQQLAYLSAVQQAAMREAIDLYISASDSANVSNFMESLLNIGRENLDRKALLELIADSTFGVMQDKSEKALTRKANGGKIKTKKRKGLTC